MHPADADYSRFNAPDEAALTEMMESALALAEMAQGKGRRRVDAGGRGLPIDITDGVIRAAERIAADFLPDVTRRPPPPQDYPLETMIVQRERTRPDFEYSEAMFTDAVAKAHGETEHLLSARDQVVIASSFEVIADRVRAMRGLAAVAESAILGHALNSIDLGLVGLAKVTEGQHGSA